MLGAKSDSELKAVVRRESHILDQVTWNGAATDPIRYGEAARRLSIAMNELEARGYEWYWGHDNGLPNQPLETPMADETPCR